MPVVRVSETTWERLKVHARPLEDTVDDVLSRALDALEGASADLAVQGPKPTAKPKAKRIRGDKLPQKDFRSPLLATLAELGGKARVKEIKRKLEPKISPRLRPADYGLVTTGDPRWWNAACWERMDMVRDGLLEASVQKGVWRLSETGWKAARALKSQ